MTDPSAGTTRLLLLRHAQSEWNAVRRWQGRADPGLSAQGREHAAAAAERLRGLVEIVVSSPQIRARQTADIIAAALGLPDVHLEPGLVEIDVGAFTGLTITEVEARYGEELAAWRAGTADSTPGGEHRDVFLQRIVSSIERLSGTFGGLSVLVVTHGGVIGRLERHLDAFPGRSVAQLEGRWFEWNGRPVPLSERIEFAGEEGADEVR
jgi:probable phosphoglycerate mutase